MILREMTRRPVRALLSGLGIAFGIAVIVVGLYSRDALDVIIDLQFDRDGNATGSIMLAARVTADKDGRFIQVENFATQPIPLTDIHTDHE